MKRELRTRASLVVVLFLAGLPTAFANSGDPINELESSSNSALIFGSGVNTSFGIGAGYSRLFMDMIQGTALANFSVTSYPIGGITTLTLKVGPTVNYSLDASGIKNAFYFHALGGLSFGRNSTSGTGNNTTDFAYGLQLGKRFEIFSNLCWKPAFDMSGVTATGTNPVFSLIPAQFSYFF